MKPYQRRLIARCLRIAAESFSNHGCNDFNFDDGELELTKAEKRETVLAIADANGDVDELELVKGQSDEQCSFTTDWCLMYHLADLLEGEA